MRNVLLSGVGGQGTVLAAKVLAQAAQDKGWQVRTAETIGMAQRGGNVVSHVRMGDAGEEVFAPLLAEGTAALSDKPYRADNVLANIERSLAGIGARFVAVDDVALTDAVGSRKVLNSVLLASALKEGRIALDLDDLRRALEECVKPRFVALNLAAVDAVAAR